MLHGARHAWRFLLPRMRCGKAGYFLHRQKNGIRLVCRRPSLRSSGSRIHPGAVRRTGSRAPSTVHRAEDPERTGNQRQMGSIQGPVVHKGTGFQDRLQNISDAQKRHQINGGTWRAGGRRNISARHTKKHRKGSVLQVRQRRVPAQFRKNLVRCVRGQQPEKICKTQLLNYLTRHNIAAGGRLHNFRSCA